jgi:Na+/H+-translocating membrane pyrophosphatase
VNEDQALIAELTELALSQAAPDELVLFDDTAQEYFADPQAALTASSKDTAVGFGLELVMITPVALAVGGYVLQALASLLSERALVAGGRSASSVLRKLLRKGQPDPTLTLTPEQTQYVRQVALERANALGMPPQQAHLLADSFVGALVTAG